MRDDEYGDALGTDVEAPEYTVSLLFLRDESEYPSVRARLITVGEMTLLNCQSQGLASYSAQPEDMFRITHSDPLGLEGRELRVYSADADEGLVNLQVD